jgi:hypothetical protein
MKLLDEIVDLATNAETQPSVLLRKLLILAYRLRNETLRMWVEKELNGYGPTDELPDYRLIQTHSTGTFFGPAGSRMENIPLATMVLKEQIRKHVETINVTSGIAAYEGRTRSDHDNWTIPWPPNLIAINQSEFFKGYALVSARQHVPASAVALLLDAVQNRILKFALELQSELQEMGGDTDNLPPERIEKTVINFIFGGRNIIAGQMGDIHQADAMIVERGDFKALTDALEKLGVNDRELPELQKAIEDDAKAIPRAGLGQRTRLWIEQAALKLAGKVGDAGLEVAKAQASAEITKLLSSFIGGP